MELNTVPYKQFLQAYSGGEDISAQEEQKNNQTQKYLELISQGLINKNKGVREIFRCDSNGNILAEDFINGIKLLDMGEIPKDDLLIMLEALQNNPEDRIVCVDIKDLEDIMENYGIKAKNIQNHSENESDLESLAGITEGHVQKVSLLDTAQLEVIEGNDLENNITFSSIEYSIFDRLNNRSKSVTDKK